MATEWGAFGDRHNVESSAIRGQVLAQTGAPDDPTTFRVTVRGLNQNCACPELSTTERMRRGSVAWATQINIAAPPEGDAASDAVAELSPRDARSEGQRLLSFLDDEVEGIVGLVRAVLPPERVGAIGHHEVG
jgi:hypothetical protein